MDFDKMCPTRSDRKNGFVVITLENGKEKNWYHVKSLKRLIKFIANIHKRGTKFNIYKCSSKEKMSNAMIKKIMSIGKEEKEKLMLDDN